MVANRFSLTRCMLITLHLHSTWKIYLHIHAMSTSTLHKKDASPHMHALYSWHLHSNTCMNKHSGALNRFFKYIKEKTRIFIDQIPNDNKYLKQGMHVPKQSSHLFIQSAMGIKTKRENYFGLSEEVKYKWTCSQTSTTSIKWSLFTRYCGHKNQEIFIFTFAEWSCQGFEAH